MSRAFFFGCILSCSALLAQNSGNSTDQSTSPTIIPIGGGGGTGWTPGIKLQCNILGASSTPSNVTGTMSHLGGDVALNLPWNGKTSTLSKGRAVLQFNPVFLGVTQYHPLPSNRVLHYGNQNTCQVTYVPNSTSVGFISGLEITQGTQTSANNIPLVQGRPALLKILGCGLNFPSASYTITFTGSDGTPWNFSTTGDLSTAVNNGAWDGDPIQRCTVFQIPEGLLVPGVQIKVTMTNAPAAPYGRTDLFPSTLTTTPAYVFNHIPTIRIVPITIRGVRPAIMDDSYAWNVMVEKLRGYMPWVQPNLAIYTPMAYEDLRRNVDLIAPWARTNMDTWNVITKTMYYQMGAGDPIVGLVDGLTPEALHALAPYAGGVTLYASGSGGNMLPVSTILTYQGDPSYTAQIFGHEFGHQSQRHHAPSSSPGGQVALDPDSAYPYQNGNSSTGSIFTPQDSNGTSDLAPSRGAYGSATETIYSHDLMSYGGYPRNAGTSDYTYLGIKQYWGSTVVTFSTTLLSAPKALEHPLPSAIEQALKAPDLTTFHERAKGLIQAMP